MQLAEFADVPDELWERVKQWIPPWRRSPAANADIANKGVRKSGMLKIIEVLDGRWEMLLR